MKGALAYVIAATSAVGGVFLCIVYFFEWQRVALDGGALNPPRTPPFYYASESVYNAYNFTFMAAYLIVFVLGTWALMTRKRKPILLAACSLALVYFTAMVLAAV